MNFDGNTYRTAENWNYVIKPPNFPINYLEIGVNCGANLFSVAETFASNPKSKLYGIDPWEDYVGYNEYINEQDTIYNKFLKNLSQYKDNYKITPIRGYSNQIIPTFPDEYFDIIYIDGNHEPEFILEDAVLSFRKLKKDGYLIFDDYDWSLDGDKDHNTINGIESFISAYRNRIDKSSVISINTQVFVKKIN